MRVRLRTLLIAVAIAAVILASVQAQRRWAGNRTQAARHESIEQFYIHVVDVTLPIMRRGVGRLEEEVEKAKTGDEEERAYHLGKCREFAELIQRNIAEIEAARAGAKQEAALKDLCLKRLW